MTKLRAADSIEDAVKQAEALLGAGVISIALSHPTLGITVSESLIGKWGDPEAPQRIGLHQALAIEGLLIKTGNAPVFGELFARLVPREPDADAETDPVRAAMHTTRDAAQLMDRVDRAMVDGQLSSQEIIGLRVATAQLQKKIAKFRRTLVVRPAARKP